MLTLFFFINIFAGQALSAGTGFLPSLPEHLYWEQNTNIDRVTISSAVDYVALLEKKGFRLKEIRESRRVPPIYAINLPGDLSSLPVTEKTSLFISLLLPNVVKVNSSILQVRKELEVLVHKIRKGETLNTVEMNWLSSIADDYSGSVDNPEDLLKRVDIIPTPLVLAQAIDESGWGTSHFAVAGNALYGEHLPAGSKGKFLSTPGGHVKVAAFDSLYLATASYIHNLNSTRAYEKLRMFRSESRQKQKKLAGYDLATALKNYSALGDRYVHILQSIISHNHLYELDNAQLESDSPVLLVEFSRK